MPITIAYMAKAKAASTQVSSIIVDDAGLNALIDSANSFSNLIAPVIEYDVIRFSSAANAVDIKGKKFIGYVGGSCINGTPYPSLTATGTIQSESNGTPATISGTHFGYWNVESVQNPTYMYGSGVGFGTTAGAHALCVNHVASTNGIAYNGTPQHEMSALIGAFGICMWNKNYTGAQSILMQIKDMIESGLAVSKMASEWIDGVRSTLGIQSGGQ